MKLDPSHDTALRETITAALKAKGFLLFSDLCTAHDINTDDFDELSSLQAALARLGADDHAAERPLLTAAVVESESMLPPKAFFIQARELGRYTGPLTGKMTKTFHDSEMKRVAGFWRSAAGVEKFSRTAEQAKKMMPSVSVPRVTEELIIKWEQPGAKSGEDRFPVSLFAKVCADHEGEHPAVTKKGAEVTARYKLTVSGRTAVLNYEAFKGDNSRAGIDLGRLRLTFRDPDRLVLEGATFHPTGGQEFPAAFKEATVAPATLKPYLPEPGDAPGDNDHTEFSRRLRLAYGNECMITGCNVGEVLEATHIERYMNPSHDHPANGLLLRRDIRALFDGRLLAIDPMTLTVRMSDTAKAYKDYNVFDGRRLREPVRGYQAYGVDRAALDRRWKEAARR